MKVIQFYKNEKQLIKKAIKGHRDAQRKLYDMHAPKMLSVCRTYVKDVQFAEEVMLSGFLKVFTNLQRYRFEGSFEGWIRKIMVNESISFLRKQKDIVFVEEVANYTEASWDHVQVAFGVAQLQELIDQLPEGYRMVFVLYAIEGYKHHEIATMLGISEGTSKSQLFKARKMLQQQVNKQNRIHNGAIEV